MSCKSASEGLARVHGAEQRLAAVVFRDPARAVRSQLPELGVPAADIRYEVFGPDLRLGQD
jgi:hypothetical protein